MELSTLEKTTLMGLARGTIRRLLNGLPPEPVDEAALTHTLQEKCGVFVSIYRGHELRGSVGYTFPILPLWKAVVENAQNAAFRDQRFPPLSRDELDSTTIEISILNKPRLIVDVSDISIETDAIILRKGFRQAVLLPQTAVKKGWDVPKALKHLVGHVGMSQDELGPDDSLEVFQADTFSEKGVL